MLAAFAAANPENTAAAVDVFLQRRRHPCSEYQSTADRTPFINVPLPTVQSRCDSQGLGKQQNISVWSKYSSKLLDCAESA